MYEQLLSGSEPWLQYAIRRNLCHESEENLLALKQAALRDAKIHAYLNDITNFHNAIVRNHKDPGLSIHKLLFLLDIGFGTDIPQIAAAIEQILSHRDSHGVYQSLTNIPPHYGGLGEDVFGWCLCDAPLLLLALAQAGVDDAQLKPGVEHLVSLYTAQGFPCAVSAEHGSFRGPGRKGDCCPVATLFMLKLLAELDAYRNSEVAKGSADTLLSLWENSRERHPYLFYMGTDFRKLKAPAMWYDIVSVADCLSKFAFARTDARFGEMVALIQQSRTRTACLPRNQPTRSSRAGILGKRRYPRPI